MMLIYETKLIQTRYAFCGTWYLPIATSTMNELFL